MKLKTPNITALVTVVLLTACQDKVSSELPVVQEPLQVINSQTQWPMFSGPNGSGQIEAQVSAPTAWSVRNKQNILWETPLPAGGQSGIAVWGNNVFFTINTPLDTPKYAELAANHDVAEKAYKSHYKKVIESINNDAEYVDLQVKVESSNENWSVFIEDYKKTKLKHLSKLKKKHALKKANREHPLAKAVVNAEKTLVDFIHGQTPELLKAHKDFMVSQKQIKAKGMGKDVILYCVNASDGKVQWQQTISGVVDTMYNYAFSDATSPTPTTDGKNVWVVNASGGMASFTVTGEKVWEKNWQPSIGRPFNKQYDTLMSGDLIFNVEPPQKDDTTRNQEWNYIHAINKNTGKTEWVSTEALTHYNTPMLGKTKSGEPALLIGRGGPHGVPEKDEGLTLLDLKGQVIWNWKAEMGDLAPWGATDIQLWNADTALWIDGKNDLALFTIDAQTGKTKKKYDLTQVSRYVYNEETKGHKLQSSKKTSFERQPYTLVLLDDALYYLVRYEPYIGYLNLKTGEHVQLEIPTELTSTKEQADGFIWKTMHKTDQLNAKGQRHNTESRSQGDGTQKAFLASPIVVNKNIYFTNAHGLTYIVDTTKPFNEKALVAVNDLGTKGETYSLSSMAYADGVLYQRSLKAIYAIK